MDKVWVGRDPWHSGQVLARHVQALSRGDIDCPDWSAAVTSWSCDSFTADVVGDPKRGSAGHS